MKLEYIDSMTDIDYKEAIIYEDVETGFFHFRIGNYVSGNYTTYTRVVRALERRGFRF